MIVTYQSKTGFTKKYAEWISEALGCEMKDIKDVTAQDVAAQDIVIHGGWLMGGMVKGLDKVRKMNPNKLVVFGVGFTPKGIKDEEFAQTNQMGTDAFFYLEGGVNPEKMGFFGKKIVEMVAKQKLTYTDHTKKENIDELITYVKSLV